MPECTVCEGQEGRGAPRYKCPKCRAPYCSVACYAQHRTTAHPPPEGEGALSVGCLTSPLPESTGVSCLSPAHVNGGAASPPITQAKEQGTSRTTLYSSPTDAVALRQALQTLQQQALLPHSRMARILQREPFRAVLRSLHAGELTLAQALLREPDFAVFLEEVGVLQREEGVGGSPS